MRVYGVGFSPLQWNYQVVPAPKVAGNFAPVVSKEDMLKILNLVMYNQTGMAYKLARVAAQMYAGMNLDFSA